MLVAFNAPSSNAQKLNNQSEVDAGLKALRDADQEAKDNLPGNRRVREAEDALDKAIRENEDIPSESYANNDQENDRREKKREAEKKQKEAQEKADSIKDEMSGPRSTKEQRTRAENYRAALKKRRDAAKNLKRLVEGIVDTAGKLQQQGNLELSKFYAGWRGKIEAEIRKLMPAPEAKPATKPATKQATGTPRRTASAIPGTANEGTRLATMVQNIPSGSQVWAPTIIAEGSGGFIAINTPDQGFLARELQGSGVQQFNQVNPTQRLSGASGRFKISADDAPRPQDRIYVAFDYFSANASSSGGAYDPGANHRLNIPGPTGGASGFSLGANPLNQVANILFSNKIESFGGSGGVRVPFISTLEGLTVDGGIGVSVNRLTMDQSFGGQIFGFARDFLYTTNVDVNSAALDLSFGISQLVRTPGGGVIVFRGDATVSPTYLSGSGTDRLNFTGFAPSSADPSKTATDLGFSINGAIESGFINSTVVGNRISGPSIFIQGGYESRPGFPVIIRDGNGPSRIDFKNADIAKVSGGLRIGFSPPR